jgi:hypothetical protein
VRTSEHLAALALNGRGRCARLYKYVIVADSGTRKMITTLGDRARDGIKTGFIDVCIYVGMYEYV